VKQTILEANIVDLSEEEIKAYLLHSHESLKAIEEEKKKDPKIEEMRQALKSYVDSCYNDDIKHLKARLKAARSVAKARGIAFKLPAKGY
jgi:hypothetical protein